MAKITKDMIIADLVKMDENIIPILMREGMHWQRVLQKQQSFMGWTLMYWLHV